VGEAFYGQLLKSLRSTQQKPAYFHGGQGEQVFRQQFDQLLVEKMSHSESNSLGDAMFELFQLHRG
jgi:Rod binding domain-containing protein